MIRKVICPVDFSEPALNASEYAAKVAQLFGAELLLVHVYALSATRELAHVLEGESRENSLGALHQQLNSLSEEIHRAFKVTTASYAYLTRDSLPVLLNSFEPAETIMVMGTHRGPDIQRSFFGSNTYQVITQVKCPVMMVPDGCSYGSVARIVLAVNPDSNLQLPFAILSDILDVTSAQLTMLYVDSGKEFESRELFQNLTDNLNLFTKTNLRQVKKEVLHDSNVAVAINEYMLKSGADLLAITFFDYEQARRFFMHNITRSLSESATYPLLVLHGT